MAKQLSRLVINHPWKVVLATLLLVAVAAAGMRHITFSSDIRAFFGPDNPQLKQLQKFENRYTRDDVAMIVIHPEKGDVFNRRTLTLAKEITDWGWTIPYSTRVDSLTNFQHSRADGDDLIVTDLAEKPRQASDAKIKEIKETALGEPRLLHTIVSPSGHVTSVILQFTFPPDKEGKNLAVVRAIQQKIKELEKQYPDHRFYTSGGLLVEHAFYEASKKDILTLVPVMYTLMILVIWFSIRSLPATLMVVLVIAFSGLTAMGLAGWAGLLLTPPSANAPTIILTLAVADSIHFLVTMLYAMRHGTPKEDAIRESLRINLQPIFLTSLTTAIGFLSMNFSDVPPFQDLGNIVAIGVTAALLFSVTFLPAAVRLLPIRVPEHTSKSGVYIDRFADWTIAHRKKLFWGMPVGILILFSGLPGIELNDIYVHYFGKRFEFRQDLDYIENNLTALRVVEYSLDTGEPGGINEPAFLRHVQDFTDWLKQQPEVKHVYSQVDTLKRLNMNMHGDDPDYYRIPDRRDLAAQYLMLYELSLPFGLNLNTTLTQDKAAMRLQIYMHKVMNKEMVELDNRAYRWMEKNWPEELRTRATGLSVVFAHINMRNIHAMLKGTFAALILISAVLIFALRSFKLGLASLIPNVVPAAMAFGLWGWAVGRVGLAASIIAAISLGIVVDDTVHFLSKYLRSRRESGNTPEEAVRYAFHSVGRALVITSLTLIVGFGVLAFSGFKINANTGILTAAAIAMALVVDFLYLPALLIWLETKKPTRNKRNG